MNLEYFNNYYHVDISTQINNSWKEDTALGIVKDSRRFSIKIKGKDKEEIKRKFIWDDDSDSARKHNNKIVALVYSYLLYKALCYFSEANSLLLCRDVRPERFVIHYLNKIANYFNNRQILNRKIEFRKRDNKRQEKLPKSLAGKYIRKVFQGKISPTKILDQNEFKELIEIINKIL
ncbi:MAG: hypothetical protein AABW67_02605 [Nanoarchaeota archaeon]